MAQIAATIVHSGKGGLYCVMAPSGEGTKPPTINPSPLSNHRETNTQAAGNKRGFVRHLGTRRSVRAARDRMADSHIQGTRPVNMGAFYNGTTVRIEGAAPPSSSTPGSFRNSH